jgi:hypothetical protein
VLKQSKEREPYSARDTVTHTRASRSLLIGAGTRETLVSLSRASVSTSQHLTHRQAPQRLFSHRHECLTNDSCISHRHECLTNNSCIPHWAAVNPGRSDAGSIEPGPIGTFAHDDGIASLDCHRKCCTHSIERERERERERENTQSKSLQLTMASINKPQVRTKLSFTG